MFLFGTASVCQNYPTKIFMANTRLSSSRAPGEDSPFINFHWQHFELNPETKFDIVGAFREIKDVKWARKQFKKRKLMPLLQPVYHVYHPRFVRLFYQNMTFDPDQPGVLSSTIDDVEFQVTIEDIAEVLGCPHECPSPRFTEPPSEFDVHMIVQDMCEGEYADKKKNCTSKAKLPSKLWLVDTVLKKNVCPLGHKTQRTGEFLATLYAFYKKHWFSAPQLIWSQMHKCWDEYVDKRLLGENKTLPFPFLVTKLVVSKGFEIEDTDNIATTFPEFGLAQWNRSTSHMKRRAPAPVQDVEMEDTAAEMAEGEPSVRLEDRVPLSHTEYELLQEELQKIHQRQAEFGDTLQSFGATLQEILSRLPPAPPAP
jgi:hypothetical protein